jgi:hypothetical protein
MIRKIPADAFSYYFSLGIDRSYQAVAEKYGVSKRSVTKLAKRENWTKRIQEIDKKAQEAVDKKMTESLEQMTERHIKFAKLIQKKALEALKSMPLGTAMDGIRALDLAVKQERLIRGEPTDRNAISVEDVIRREYDRWMVGDVSQEPEEDADGGD